MEKGILNKENKKYTCIYCLEIKNSKDFGREHVLHDGFGKYEPRSFVLRDKQKKIFKVCLECNNKLGITIDQDLLRATFEGVQRFHFGIKGSKEFDFRRYTKNQERFIKDGILKGLEVIPVFSPQEDAVVIVPKKDDFGLKRKDGCYYFFTINNIPERKTAEQDYFIDDKQILILWVDRAEEIIKAIKTKWSYDRLEYKTYENTSDIDVSYKATYTKSVFRAIAKIAFNYLAYFYDNSVMLQENFNPIRNFICKGDEDWRSFIKINKDPILYEEYNETILGHTIAINITYDKSIIISLSLFNLIHYKVYLALNYNGMPINTGCGHFFNPINHTICTIQKSSIIPIQAVKTLKIVKTPIFMPRKLF